jgi:hypothetical protein
MFPQLFATHMFRNFDLKTLSHIQFLHLSIEIEMKTWQNLFLHVFHDILSLFIFFLKEMNIFSVEYGENMMDYITPIEFKQLINENSSDISFLCSIYLLSFLEKSLLC